MDVVHPKCAGLDVHPQTVVACARTGSGKTVAYDVRTFGTSTPEWLALRDWLSAHGGTHVALESRGVYWKPVWPLLDGHFELVLANAMHIRNIPGRKSDVNDATWIADLLAHGLIRSSFVPPASVQERRDLTRPRKQLVREIAQHPLRIQKTLETANVKLASVLEALEAAVREVEARVGEALAPVRAAVDHLITMPGVRETVARVIVAEIGFDMTRFPSAAHLVSWAGRCPRRHESAGKRLANRTRSSNPWLQTPLVQAAWSATRKKDSYFRAQFLRIKSRRGPQKAVLAVAASMLTAAYHMLRDDADYRDLGAAHFDRRDKTRLAKRLIARLHDLGLVVEVRAA